MAWIVCPVRTAGRLPNRRRPRPHQKKQAALVCQELIEVELSAQIGADRYERTGSRVNERNGHRPRVLSTKAGDVELAIPKLRKGASSLRSSSPDAGIDQALYRRWSWRAYVHGVSTRAVDELVGALGVSSGISRSEVSRICGQLDEVVDSFRERRLDHVAFPTCISTPPTSTSERTTR